MAAYLWNGASGLEETSGKDNMKPRLMARLSNNSIYRSFFRRFAERADKINLEASLNSLKSSEIWQHARPRFFTVGVGRVHEKE